MGRKKQDRPVLESVRMTEEQLSYILSEVHHSFYGFINKKRLTVRECTRLTGLNSHVFTDIGRDYRLSTLVLCFRVILTSTRRNIDGTTLMRLLMDTCAESRSLAVRSIDDGEPLRHDETLLLGPAGKPKKKPAVKARQDNGLREFGLSLLQSQLF